jgi:TP901 family phage tail tape measure protein
MPLESWVVAATYNITGSTRFLIEATKRANEMAVALERLTKSTEEAQVGIDAFLATAAKLDASLAGTSRGISNMSAATTRAATRIDTGANTIAASYDRVTAAAARAESAVVGFARSNAIASRSSIAGVSGGVSRGHAGAVNAGTVGAIGATAFLGYGVHGASSLQDAFAQTAVASGLKTSDAQRLYQPVAIAMSNATAQSVAQSTQLLRVMATSGFNDPKDLTNTGKDSLPLAIARYADTQYLGRHKVPFEESVALATQLAHQLGTRSGSSLRDMLNTLFKVSQDMPDSVSSAATQIKYYGPQFTQAGVTPSEILQLQATADRLGLGGGRSGTGFRALYASLINPSDKNLAAERGLGLLDRNGKNRFINQRTGAFNVEGFFGALNERYDQARKQGTVGNYNELLGRLSTSGAGSVLSLFSSDAGREQRKKVEETMKRVPDLVVAQEQLMNTLNNQTKRLGSNFSTLATLIAQPLIEPLTNFIKAIGDGINVLTDFLSAHPGARNLATAAVTGAGAFGAVQVVRAAGGASVFIHAASHRASESLGLGRAGVVGGELAAARGGGVLGAAGRGAGRVGTFAADIFGFSRTRALAGRGIGAISTAVSERAGPALARQFPGFASLGEGLGKFLFESKLFAVGLREIGGMAFGWIFRLGSRFIPFVGEVLLAIDALKFFGAHAKDIGWIIGRAARWIMHDGAPMLLNAFIEVVKFIVKGIVDSIAGIFQGFHGGIWDAIRNFVIGVQQGAADDPVAKKGAGIAGAGHTAASAHQKIVQQKAAMAKPASSAQQTAYLGAGGGDVYYIDRVHVEHSGDNLESLIRKVKLKSAHGDGRSSGFGHSGPATVNEAGILSGMG